MPKTEKKPKAPKPQRIKCKGGPHTQLRMEGGIEPVERIPFSNGAYVLRRNGEHYLYEWFAGEEES